RAQNDRRYRWVNRRPSLRQAGSSGPVPERMPGGPSPARGRPGAESLSSAAGCLHAGSKISTFELLLNAAGDGLVTAGRFARRFHARGLFQILSAQLAPALIDLAVLRNTGKHHSGALVVNARQTVEAD